MMKRITGLLACLVMLVGFSADSFADNADQSKAVILPGNLIEIEEEAFMGNTGITTVFIPKTVDRIGSHAFSGCTNLTEVYFGKNQDIDIEGDAFDQCGDIRFYAYPETAGELYALCHGYSCELLEEGSSALEMALALVEEYGGTGSILQSSEFDSMRLIVKMSTDRLPDISSFNPVKIVREENDIFFIQFSTVEDTIYCLACLLNDERVEFAEPDAYVEVMEKLDGLEEEEDIFSAGVVSDSKWDTEDPMGFDVYAPFIAQNGNGRVTVAVLDSGVKKIPAYLEKLRPDAISLIPGDTDWADDKMMHGSFIAGIINDCVGEANVEILPIKVVNSQGLGDIMMIANGIKYALEHGASVINMSLNFEESKYVRFWLERAKKAGIDVVVAAGNNQKNIDINNVFPANVDSVITVSGIDQDYELSAHSNYGNNVSFCAPDSYLKTTAYPRIVRNDGGTSFSSAMVSAALALVKLDLYHSYEDLVANCRDLGADGHRNWYGHGLIQLDKLAHIYPFNITLSESLHKQMAAGEKQILEWSIWPENSTETNVAVVSSDESVVSVMKDGEGNVLVNALKEGKSTITISVEVEEGEQNIEDSMEISVVNPVTSISITASGNKLSMAGGVPIQVSVHNILPVDATNKNCIFQSSDETVAVISPQGVVTPVSVGHFSIFAEAADGYSAFSNTLEMEVVNFFDAEKVVITDQNGIILSDGQLVLGVAEPSGEDPIGEKDQQVPNVLLDPGESLQIVASVLPEGSGDAVLSYTCDPDDILTLSGDGLISSAADENSRGSGIITATAQNGLKAELLVEVMHVPRSIRIFGDELVFVGESTFLTAYFTPENASNQSIRWVSEDDDIATVTSNGIVRGVIPGTVNIYAVSTADPDVFGTITIRVLE